MGELHSCHHHLGAAHTAGWHVLKAWSPAHEDYTLIEVEGGAGALYRVKQLAIQHGSDS